MKLICPPRSRPIVERGFESGFYLFVHDHKVLVVNGKTFSVGSIGDLSQYSDTLGTVISLTRMLVVDRVPNGQIELDNPMAANLGVKSLLAVLRPGIFREVWRLVKRSNGLIVRLPSILGLTTIGIARLTDRPYLVEVVGFADEAYRLHSRFGALIAAGVEEAMRRAVRDAPYCVYVSESAMRARYPTSGKSTSISNVIVHTSVERDLTGALVERGAVSPGLILGTAGRVDLAYKGQSTVIRSLPRLIALGLEPVYRLAGGGDSARLRDLATELGVSERVEFYGQLGRSELETWYRGLDIYIQPSLTEGLPRALIEAMSQGVPSIGSAVGGIPELLGSEYLFDSGSSSGLSELVLKLTDPSVAQANRVAVVERSYSFDYDNLTARRARFLREFMSDK